MKIAVVIENYIAGGSDVVARAFSELDKDNEYCYFVNYKNDERNLLPLQLNSNIIYYYCPTIPDINLFLSKMPIGILVRRFLKSILYPIVLFIVLMEVNWKIKRFKPDIIICNNGGYPGGYVTRFLPFCNFRRTKQFIMMVHNLPTPAKFLSVSKLIDTLLEKIVTFVSVSEKIKEDLKVMRGIDSLVLVNSHFKNISKIDYKTKYAQNDGIKLWCIGSFTPIKNQIDLVEKLISIEAKILCKIELNFVGLIDNEDDFYKQLKSLVAKLDDIEVVFHGFLVNFTYPNQPHQYLIINSIREGLPLVMLEAMAFGIPIISKPIGGIPEVIKNENQGFLYEGIDQFEEIIQTISSLSVDKWAKLSDKSYHASLKYSKEKYLEKYKGLLK